MHVHVQVCLQHEVRLNVLVDPYERCDRLERQVLIRIQQTVQQDDVTVFPRLHHHCPTYSLVVNVPPQKETVRRRTIPPPRVSNPHPQLDV